MSEVADKAVLDHVTIVTLAKRLSPNLLDDGTIRANCEKHLALFEAMKEIVSLFELWHPAIHDAIECKFCAAIAAYKTVADDVLGGR